MDLQLKDIPFEPTWDDDFVRFLHKHQRRRLVKKLKNRSLQFVRSREERCNLKTERMFILTHLRIIALNALSASTFGEQ